MAANILDKITAVKNGVNPTTTTVSVVRAALGTSLTVVDSTGWPTVSAVQFATYKVDVNNNKIAGSQIDWKATLSGSVLGNLTRVGGAADTGNAIGDIVQMMPTATYGHDLYQALTNEHDQLDGKHRLTQLVDTNNNEFIKLAQVASAVNEITVTNAATGNAPSIATTGGDANADLKVDSKGTGRVIIDGAGIAVAGVVDTSETTSSTTYADLTTTTDSATVTVGKRGLLYVSFGARISNSGGGANSLLGIALSGTATVAATDNYSILYQSTAPAKFSETKLFTGLAAGSYTVKLKYRVSSGVGTYVNRHVEAIPL